MANERPEAFVVHQFERLRSGQHDEPSSGQLATVDECADTFGQHIYPDEQFERGDAVFPTTARFCGEQFE